MPPSILVHLKMKPAAEGGRSTSFATGYRPHLVVPPDGTYLGVIAVRCSRMAVSGEEAEVLFDLVYHPEVDYSVLQVGREFEVREGSKIVATGHVKERTGDMERA